MKTYYIYSNFQDFNDILAIHDESGMRYVILDEVQKG
jgi:hypothetical protein